MGSIRRKAEYLDDQPSTISDGLELARFGFAYDEGLNRAVAIFLRDLNRFAPEQQQFMSGSQLPGEYELHPGFYQQAILGQWRDRISIYDAFLEEKEHINAMCGLMGKPPLFKTGRQPRRPHGFGILLRPTQKEFSDFVLRLNQLLVDDLNTDFFEGDIPTAETNTKADGKEIKTRIGTISLLESWLTKYFRLSSPDDLRNVFKNLRKLRDLRARPAHVSEDNVFDQRFVHEQRELIMDAFFVVRELRMILENHPRVRGYVVPTHLREGNVWPM